MPSWRILLSCAALVALAFPAGAAPDENLLGKAAGYPLGNRFNWFFDESVRVGSFSHLDRFLPHNSLKKSDSPLPLPAASNPPKIGYRFDRQTYSLDDFLAHQRITGLLVIKDGQILAERYQYDRTATDRDGPLRVALDGEVHRQSRRRHGAGGRQDRIA